jgi:hypothetical protein
MKAVNRILSWISPYAALVGAAAVAGLLLAACHESGSSEPVRTVDGVTVYLGVVPSSVVAERLPAAGQAMHGAVTPHSHHVLIAMFDAESGQRLNGTVSAAVSSRHGDAGTKPLEEMNIGGMMTYGNYFPMEDSGTYTIEVEILLASRPRHPVSVRFRYEHPQ